MRVQREGGKEGRKEGRREERKEGRTEGRKDGGSKEEKESKQGDGLKNCLQNTYTG